MTVRRAAIYVIALVLGPCAALLVACGQGTSGGIPAAAASDLKRQIEDVRQAVDAGRCGDLSGQLRQIDDRIDQLGPGVDEQLKRSLYDAADRLRTRAPTECSDNADAVTTATTTTETTATQTTETTTETVPTTTATTPTTTATTPTTEPAPPPPEPAPVPVPVPPPPPPPQGTPGGGTPPEIP